MDTKKLRQKILDLAIRGKLVPQDPNDEPASVLLERIKAEKERLIKEGKIKRTKKTAKTSDTPHYENVPFEVPSSWVWCRLDDIAFIGTGATPSTSNKSYYDKGNIAWISSGATNQPFINEASNFITEKALSETNCKIYPIGTLIVAMYGEGKTRGQVSELSIEAATNQACAAIKPYVLEIKSYIKLYLESNYLYLRKIAEGGNQPNLSVGKISAYTIPLPPLVEQRRIVSEIEHWFSLINIIEGNKEDLQASIKQAKSKIFDLAIHGKLVPQDPNDEPASELLRRINPKAEITCDNGQYRKIPKKWCVCKLVDICSFLTRGKSPKYSEDDKTYPVFAQKCNLKDGGVSLEQARFLDPSTINKWNEVYKLQTGDILVNSTGTGTVGRTRLFNTNCLGNYPFVVPDSHVSVVRVLKSICPQYVYAYISSDFIQQYMKESLAGSTNQKELYIGVLENMHIYLPPLAEQQRIVARIEELFSTLDNIQKALEA